MSEPEKVDVLQFMAVRAPLPVAAAVATRHYIEDHDRLPMPLTHVPDDMDGGSPIARLVVDEVFCREDSTIDKLVELVVESLTVLDVDCDGSPKPRRRGLLALDRIGLATRFDDDVFRVVPDRIGLIENLPLRSLLERAGVVLDTAAAAEVDAFDRDELVAALAAITDEVPLWSVAFTGSRHSAAFRDTHRGLFDALYTLYILRRRVPIGLDRVIEALQVLHALEWLAIDAFVADARRRGRAALDSSEAELLGWLESWLPELRGGLEAAAPFDLVATPTDLRRLLDAVPVVHPIFTRLHGFRRPFNAIRPLGVGDLKVVKQWLVKYLPGEISHITNVLKGETNERTTRRLDRTEEQFGFSRETTQDTSSESTTTDRLEVKREAENVVKTDIGVKADAYFRYDNKMIQAGVSGGFAYNRSAQDSAKSAQQLAREVIDKAVSRVQSRVTEQRSVTKLFENEETVKHVVANNQPGADHVNGFYRFVDKRYTAQLYNYGKRLMFEFVVPEPAAFLVESRLRAWETGLDVPQPPAEPPVRTVQLGFTAAQIDKAKWQSLRTTYDLTGLPPYPAPTKAVMLRNQETGSPLFAEKDIPGTDDNWWAKSYTARLDADGYEIRKVRRSGSLYFVWSSTDPNVRWRDRNFYNVVLDGQIIRQHDLTISEYHAFYTPNDDVDVAPPHALGAGDLTLTLEFQNVKTYNLTFLVELALTADALSAWQTQVFNAVQRVEQERVDALNREAQLAYATSLADYRRDLAAITATSVNSLLEGGSDAANRRVMEIELRKHCLSELAKEFDANEADDRLSTIEAVGAIDDVASTYRRLDVATVDGVTVVGFQTADKTIDYPATDLPKARRKGRHLQFLEQAFEWDKLAYLFYPYFWSVPAKWIELTARADDADPVYSAFLQAGAARVLVAVSPGYRDAVMHYLDTGEPWDGGAAPVIGDPLYVPLYQELREQQDDLENAVPEGAPWLFTVPTSLVYLDGGAALPAMPGEPPP